MTRRLAWSLWALIAVAVFVYLEHQRSPATFFHDEWELVQNRRGWSFDGFITPLNQHLAAATVFVYRVLFAVFGLTHYRPFRMAGLAFHLFAATMVFAYVRSRARDIVALAAATVVALLGSGWHVLLFPAAMTYSAAIGFGLAAWLCLDRSTARSGRAAGALHVVSLLFGGAAIAFTAGSAARLALSRQWRRAAVVVGPSAILYGVWFIGWGTARRHLWSNARHLPSFVATVVGGGAGGLFGRPLMWGLLLAGALMGLAVARRQMVLAAVAPIAAIATNAVLTGLSRAETEQPDASRYVYVTAVLLLVAVADAARGFELPRWAPAVAACLTVAALVGNLDVLQSRADDMRLDSAIAGAELRAVEWARDHVSPEFRPDPRRMPQVSAGEYLAAVDELGSPAWSEAAVLAADANVRQEVDAVSARALGLGGGAQPYTGSIECAAIAYSGEVPLAAGSTVTLVAWYAPVELRFRRVADRFAAQPTVVVPGGTTVVFEVPADDAPVQSWIMQALSVADFGLCT